MGEIIKKECRMLMHNVPFLVMATISAGLIIASFIIPPTGVIHPSVLTGVGELMGFGALWLAFVAVEKGVDAEIKHNNTTVKITNDEDDKVAE